MGTGGWLLHKTIASVCKDIQSLLGSSYNSTTLNNILMHIYFQYLLIWYIFIQEVQEVVMLMNNGCPYLIITG